MYKQKLKEQIERMEKLQDRCGVNDVNKFSDTHNQFQSPAQIQKNVCLIIAATHKPLHKFCLVEGFQSIIYLNNPPWK